MLDNRIKELRESLGLNQLQMAKELGMQAQTIHRYEVGDVEPTLKNIRRIAETFNVNPAWLIGWSDDDRPERVVYVNSAEIVSRLEQENEHLKRLLASREYSLSLVPKWKGELK